MAYNKDIDARIQAVASGWKYTESKKMFGGVCHLMKGNMFCGVLNDSLILRLGEDSAKKALKLPHVRPFDITGRPMKGWVMVDQAGFKQDRQLKDWLQKAKAFANTLPAK